MGLFDIFKDINSDVRADWLIKGFNETIELMETWDEDLKRKMWISFGEKRLSIINQDIRRLSNEGRIEIGKNIQEKARKEYDYDMQEASGMWLAGAWLEMLGRNNEKLAEIFEILDEIGVDYANSLDDEYDQYDVEDEDSDFNNQDEEIEDDADEPVITGNMPDIAKCEPIEWFDIGDYSAVLVANAPNIAGVDAPFEYLYVMALIPPDKSFPVEFVTAEKSYMGGVMLCHFGKGGSHANYGDDEDWSDIENFKEAAFSILSEE